VARRFHADATSESLVLLPDAAVGVQSVRLRSPIPACSPPPTLIRLSVVTCQLHGPVMTSWSSRFVAETFLFDSL
jgi:hypothetical protein